MGQVWQATGIVLLFILIAGVPAEAQDRWDAAANRITRLEPSAFEAIPVNVRQELSDRGCTIPQAWGEDRPHNVVSGTFSTGGQTDWAALCSRGASSEILIFWGGPVLCPPLPGPEPDRRYLQNVGTDGILFSRGLSPVPASMLSRYWAFVGPEPPPELTHDAISDAFFEKGATAFYCHKGRWLQFHAD